MAPQVLLLFGDQTAEKLLAIRRLARVSKSSPLLQRFLREATDVVQNEVAKLSLHRRNAFFAFDTLVNLAEKHAKQDCPDDVVSTALITIIRLGDLILSVEALSNRRSFTNSY